MFCSYCGNKLPEDSVFCPFCGERTAAEQQKKEELNVNTPSNTYPEQRIRLGFSDKITDPAIRAAMKKNKNGTAVFAVLLVLAPFVVTLILGVKNDDMSIAGIGAVISAIFLLINLISSAKKKAEKQWDGTVIDKRVETRRKKYTPDGDRDAQAKTVYIIQFRTESGKTKTLEESDINHVYYDYLNVGDKVRYHPQFNCYYEKFDKTHDTRTICPVCGTVNNIADDTCTRCGVPVIK